MSKYSTNSKWENLTDRERELIAHFDPLHGFTSDEQKRAWQKYDAPDHYFYRPIIRQPKHIIRMLVWCGAIAAGATLGLIGLPLIDRHPKGGHNIVTVMPWLALFALTALGMIFVCPVLILRDRIWPQEWSSEIVNTGY